MYGCCPYSFSEASVHLIIRKKSFYYVFNVLTPCLVLLASIFIGFFIPPECGERVGLTMTINIAVVVFLQIVSDSLPRNSDSVSTLGMFYFIIMMESTFSLTTTCIVLYIHQCGNEANVKPIPDWARCFFVIGKWMKIERDSVKKHSIKYDENAAD